MYILLITQEYSLKPKVNEHGRKYGLVEVRAMVIVKMN